MKILPAAIEKLNEAISTFATKYQITKDALKQVKQIAQVEDPEQIRKMVESISIPNGYTRQHLTSFADAAKNLSQAAIDILNQASDRNPELQACGTYERFFQQRG